MFTYSWTSATLGLLTRLLCYRFIFALFLFFHRVRMCLLLFLRFFSCKLMLTLVCSAQLLVSGLVEVGQQFYVLDQILTFWLLLLEDRSHLVSSLIFQWQMMFESRSVFCEVFLPSVLFQILGLFLLRSIFHLEREEMFPNEDFGFMYICHCSYSAIKLYKKHHSPYFKIAFVHWRHSSKTG